MVDLERRRVIDLLTGPQQCRQSQTGCGSGPGIEVVARDHSREYARSASIGAPKAIQVADRWHLLAKVRDMLERWLARAHARLRDLPLLPSGNERCPGQRTQAFGRSRTEAAASADSRARWLTAYENVRRRHLAGEALLAVARATGLARATVRKAGDGAQVCPRQKLPRARRAPAGPQHPRPLHRLSGSASGAGLRGRDGALARGARPGIRARPQDGAEVGGREPGEAGSQDAPEMAARGTGQHSSRRRIRPWPALPSPRQLAWLLVRPTKELSPSDAAAVRRAEQDKEAAQVASLARRFTDLVRGCGIGGS